MAPSRLCRRACLDGKSVDPFLEQIRERRIDGALALETALAGKAIGDDLDGEMTLAAIGIVTGMAAMTLAVVAHDKLDRRQGLGQAAMDLAGDRAG